MILIKLGGSVITDKKVEMKARPDIIERLAREIAETGEKCVIVHGGGSFGHIKAAKYCIQQGLGDDPGQKQGIADVQVDMRKLNSLVVDAFHKAKMPVASVPAGAIAVFEDGDVFEFPVDVLSHYLDIGITPITFGDVVVDRKRGVCICSGDDIMLELARKLGAKRCIFVTEVDGIFVSYPPVGGEGPVPEIRRGDRISFTRTNVDVTGGMGRKLELMFDMADAGCEVRIVNGLVPGRLKDAIRGNDFVGTAVRSDAEKVV